MQAQSVIQESPGYASDMAGRPPTKQAPLLGQRMAALRKQRGWTQSELAERLNTTVKMVTYYEREAGNPTQKTIEAIAKVFGISPVKLMGQVKKKSKDDKPTPPSRLQKLTNRLSKLPPLKQQMVEDMLEGILKTRA